MYIDLQRKALDIQNMLKIELRGRERNKLMIHEEKLPVDAPFLLPDRSPSHPPLLLPLYICPLSPSHRPPHVRLFFKVSLASPNILKSGTYCDNFKLLISIYTSLKNNYVPPQIHDKRRLNE